MTILDFSSRVAQGLGLPAEQAVTVPGYLLGRSLAVGTTTQALLARDGSGEGCVVLLRRDEPESRRRAELAQYLTHPHLMRIREVTTATDGRLAVVAPRLGPSLREVLNATKEDGPLTAGEIAGILDGLGHALGYWHEHVGPHGDVRAENVLTDAEGRVVLIDLVEDLATLEAPASVSADVADLASLLLECAPPEVLPALSRALGPALQAEGDVDARVLAAGSAMIAPPEPLAAHRLPTKPQATLPSRAQRPAPTPRLSARNRGRRVEFGFGVVGLVLGIALGLALWLDEGSPGQVTSNIAARFQSTTDDAGGAQRSATETQRNKTEDDAAPGSDDLADAQRGSNDGTGGDTADPASSDTQIEVGVTALLTARDAALREQDALALAELTVPGSAAAAEDAAVLQSLRDAGEELLEHDTTITGITVESRAGSQVTVRGTVQQQQSVRNTPAGLRTIPAQPAHCVLLDLESGPQGLLLAQARPCAG